MEAENIISEVAKSLIGVGEGAHTPHSELPCKLQESYRSFLSMCDGGYTRDYFFHFLGRAMPVEHNLVEWNRPDLWKKYYGLPDTVFAFAENIIGDQYCFSLGGSRTVVRMFNSGTGQLMTATDDFEQFLERHVLHDKSEIYTYLKQVVQGYFKAHGESYRLFHHISHKIPGCLGGDEYDFQNMELCLSWNNLRFLGQIATQMREIPHGTVIREVVVDEKTGEIRLVT